MATRLLTFCLRNLFRRKARTVLCILGVAIAATFVIAIGATTMRYTTVIREMSVLFSGQITVVSKDALVIEAIPISGEMLPQDSTMNYLRNITGVDKATPVLFVISVGFSGVVQPLPANFSVGVPVGDWQQVLGPTPLKGGVGHFPANESGREVIVGPSIADQFNWTVGTEISVNDYRLLVSGVLDTKVGLLNRCIVMPLRLAQTVYDHEGSVNIIAVRPQTGFPVENLTQIIRQNMGYVDALTESQRNDFIQPVLEQVETWNLGIQSVVFVISLILVMTVTIMSVSERRRDFATLDAMGAPLNYVFRIVVLEAAFIGLLGGIIGIVLGSLTTMVLASLYTNIPVAQFFPSIFEIVPPLYMIEIFAAVTCVCCVGGIIPAINAMRTRIAEVLRTEY
jgi:putative ABC transport system permease protein